MKNRKTMPDIMAGLMGGAAVKPENPTAASSESGKAVEPYNPTRVITDSGKKVITANGKAVRPESPLPKEKTSFNLSLECLDKLENAWLKLRKKCKGELRITKTLMVEKALEIALEELAANGDESEFYIRLKL